MSPSGVSDLPLMLIIMSYVLNNTDFCLKQELQDAILYILFHLSGGCLFSPLSGQHLQYNTIKYLILFYYISHFLTHFNGMCPVKCYYYSHLIA